MARLSISLLGPLRVTFNGDPVEGFNSNKVRALLAYLVAEADRPHHRDRLASLLWPNVSNQEARNNLRYALSNLRGVINDRAVKPRFLKISRDVIQFNTASDYQLDIDLFSQSVSFSNFDELTIQRVEEIVHLSQGDFLEGFSIGDSVEFDEWILLKREKFNRQLVEILHHLTTYYEGEKDFERALIHARDRVKLEPWSEAAHRQVMRLLIFNDQRSEAIIQYESLSSVLKRDLDTEPEDKTRALYEQIRDGGLSLGESKPREEHIRGYVVHEILGAGHVGIVYRAHQPVVGREVAIKVIHREYSNRPNFIRRFENEARMVARLEHPHIVPLYDFWREPDGAYLVMRWIRGGNLAETIKRGRWNLEPAVQMVEQISAALSKAHRQGIVHRDIKPANILLDREDNAYLTDFGIATMIWESPEIVADPDFTDSSSSTLGYVSPEALLGEEVNPLMDIYSLGIVLYEMLAGQHPFPKLPNTQLIDKHLKESIPSIQAIRPELPSMVDEIIHRATDKDPSARFPDALSLVHAIRKNIHIDETPRDAAYVEGTEWVLHNPYKGLRPFQAADAVDFFGRKSVIEKLLSRISSPSSTQFFSKEKGKADEPGERFLVLVGPSGSGKSSVIKAGLLPALRHGALPGSENWFVVEMTPGNQPLEELEIGLMKITAEKVDNLKQMLHEDYSGLQKVTKQVLPTEADHLLLVVDQFEEIFTKDIDEANRELFIQNICMAVTDPESQVKVIITLRADFYDQPLKHPEFGSLVASHTEVLLPLSPGELTDAIEGPAKRVGVEFEAGLVGGIVQDVSEQPGALPLLQYALTELFEHRKDQILTHQAYKTIGGVSGALARRAENVFNQLDKESMVATQQLFLRLTALGVGAENTRRRVLRSELENLRSGSLDKEIINNVLGLCGRARLLTFDHDPITRQPTVEIAHEALFREWQRLRDWLDEYRDDIRTQRRLSIAADEWISSDKDSSFLLRGSRLDWFADWAKKTDLALSQNEQDFLSKCYAERKARQADKTARKDREASLEQRSRLFLRALVGILAIATVFALGLTFYSFNQNRQALEAYSLSLAANAQQALNDLDSSTALVLALAANRIENPPLEAQRILMNAAYAPGPRSRYDVETIFFGVESPATALDISPDGETVLLGFVDGTIVLWDLASGEEIRRLFGHTAQINEIIFTPDGQRALSVGDDSRVFYWDINQGVAIYQLFGHSGAVRAVDIRSDGLLAISGGFSGTSFENQGELILWDLQAGEEIRRIDGHITGVVEAVFAQDGNAILSSSGDAELFSDLGTEKNEQDVVLFEMIIWDSNSGEIIHQFEPLDHDIFDIAITSDGSRVLAASYYDNVSTLWNLEILEKNLTLEGHRNSVRAVEFSPDEQRAVTASDDGSLILWNLQSGEMIADFKAHSDNILDISIAPDGRSVISSGSDGGIIFWDFHDASEQNRFVGHGDMIWDTAFTSDGTSFVSVSGASSPAVTSKDTSIRLWNLSTGKQVKSAEIPSTVIFQVAITPDSRTALFTSPEPYVHIWDLDNWIEIGRLEGHEGWIPGIDISPDGRWVLTCSVDGTLILWDLQRREAIHRLDGHGKGLWAVAFSPDGRTALSDSGDSSMILWDLEKGQEIRNFLPKDGYDDVGSSGIAFLPDGETAISGSLGGQLIHWNLATGKEIHRFGQHNDLRTRIEISEDGRIALSSGMDGTLKLWDIEKGQLIREFGGQDQVTMFDISLSPDGLTALSGSSDKTIVHWHLMNPSLDELKDWIKSNRYVRPLTCAERELYRIEPLCEK